MRSVSYHPFFSMCVHRRTQNPLTRFSPPKAGFSRRAIVSVAPFSATGERRPTRLGGGCPFCGRGRQRARKRRPCDALRHCGFGLRMTLHDHAVLFCSGKPPGAARGGDGEHGNEQGASDCEPRTASAAGLGRGEVNERRPSGRPAFRVVGRTLARQLKKNTGFCRWPAQRLTAEGVSLVRHTLRC